jgi:hypothetical protein
MTNDEIVEAMSDAFWNVYDAEIKLGAMNWTDNRDAAMRAAFAIAEPLIREHILKNVHGLRGIYWDEAERADDELVKRYWSGAARATSDIAAAIR